MTERLRVTHVVLSLDVGGLERNVINQIREGEKLGQRASVICIDRPLDRSDRVRDRQHDGNDRRL